MRTDLHPDSRDLRRCPGHLRLHFCLVVALTAISQRYALADTASDPAAKRAEARALLAQGDFDGAARLYVAAARANPDHAEYRDQANLIRRVIQMRDRLDKLEDTPLWGPTVAALMAFYEDHELPAEAMRLAARAYAKDGSAASAAQLARARLALGQNAEALEGLRELPDDRATPETRTLTALALARLGRAAEVEGALRRGELPANPAGYLLYDLARLEAALGNADDALRALTLLLQGTPPGRLELVKERVRRSDDFASLREHPRFAQVMETASNVPESGCSAGPTCGKCPSRSACAGQEQQAGSAVLPENAHEQRRP